MKGKEYKAGIVLLAGRPNAGKSTLLNNILKTKVSITSPKPQTTRAPIQAVYEDTRGQIIFVDTPGIFGKATDTLAKKINKNVERALTSKVDVVVHVIDKTRKRDFEENKTLGMIRKINAPKILAFNKIDIKHPDHKIQYMFMKDEFDVSLEVSALTHANLNYLLDTIFSFLPTRNKIVDMAEYVFPAINISSKQFIADIIREKAFLFTRKEIPYSLTTKVLDLQERDNGVLYIKGAIITDVERYKQMLIGSNGRRIKEIGTQIRKELEAATGKKVYVDMTVEVNPHWQSQW